MARSRHTRFRRLGACRSRQAYLINRQSASRLNYPKEQLPWRGLACKIRHFLLADPLLKGLRSQDSNRSRAFPHFADTPDDLRQSVCLDPQTIAPRAANVHPEPRNTSVFLSVYSFLASA
jgi:hypothetical protein